MNSDDYDDQAWTLWRQLQAALRAYRCGGWSEKDGWRVEHLFAVAGELMHRWSHYVSRHRYDKRGYRGGRHLYDWAEDGFRRLHRAWDTGPQLPDGRPSEAWRIVETDSPDGRAGPPGLSAVEDQLSEPR